MGRIASIVAPAARSLEARDDIENPNIDLVSAIVGQEDGSSQTGINMTPERALRQSAVYACVRALAEGVGSLPLPVYERDGRSRIRVPDDARWPILNDSPNPEMYAMELHETTIAYANLWGRGYQYIVRDKGGVPTELWPLRPDRTRSHRTSAGQLYFTTDLDNGESPVLMAEEVIDVKALLRHSPVRLGREAIATSAAAEEYAARFWANGARPGGVIEFKNRLEDDEYTEFRQRWLAGHQGLRRSQLVGILTNGAEWKDVGIAPGLAQFIETRQFSVRDIARLFRVPPHVIGDLEGTVSRASIEQQAIEFVVYSLRSWLVRYEQALKGRMFNGRIDRAAQRYPEFLVDGLMRGDTNARYTAYAKGIQFGWLSRADVRELENLTYVEGLDTYLVPVNMMDSNAVPGPDSPLPDQQASLIRVIDALELKAGRPLSPGEIAIALTGADPESGMLELLEGEQS